MGPEPDQPAPTTSCDQSDSDNTTTTTHNTGKRTKKSEMEDVYTWSDTDKDQLASFLETDPAFHVHLGLEFSSK